MIFKRKIYNKLLDWKENYSSEKALLIEGARRIGKSTIVEEFAKKEFKSYLFIDFNDASISGEPSSSVVYQADVKITGAEYDTGKLSSQKVNQKLITGNVISSNKSGNAKAEKEIKEQLRRHLFMAEVSSVRVSTTPLRVSAKIKTRSAVVAGDFLSMFGIHLFEYEGNDQAQGDFEIDQIRRWNALEGAMD